MRLHVWSKRRHHSLTREHALTCRPHAYTYAAGCTIREPVHVCDCSRSAPGVDCPAPTPVSSNRAAWVVPLAQSQSACMRISVVLAHRSIHARVCVCAHNTNTCSVLLVCAIPPMRRMQHSYGFVRAKPCSSQRAAVQCAHCIASFLVRRAFDQSWNALRKEFVKKKKKRRRRRRCFMFAPKIKKCYDCVKIFYRIAFIAAIIVRYENKSRITVIM